MNQRHNYCRRNVRRLVVLLMWGLSASAISVAVADEVAPVRVLIIDGQNNHNWRETTPILKKQLDASGRFKVAISSNLKEGDKPGHGLDTEPFPPDLSRYDVVLSNYNGQSWPKAFQQDFVLRVRQGKLGFVLFHAANNCFSDWPEFNEMIGMGWRNAKFGDRIYFDDDGKQVRVNKGDGRGVGETRQIPFPLVVRQPDHPITRGMPREWMHAPDQLVHACRGPIVNVQVLATAYSPPEQRGTGFHEPMIWTVNYGEGRVVQTPMGHGVVSVKCVGFLTTLMRGLEWAATGDVTLPIPVAFPRADQPSLVDAKE